MNIINFETSNPYVLERVIIRYLIRYGINYLSIENDNGFEVHFDHYILRIVYKEIVIDKDLDDLSKLLNNIIKQTEELNKSPNIDTVSDKRYDKNSNIKNNQLRLTKRKNRKLNIFNNKCIYRRR